MYNLLEILAFGGIIISYLITTIIIFLAIQFATYQLTGFSIWKFIEKLIREEI